MLCPQFLSAQSPQVHGSLRSSWQRTEKRWIITSLPCHCWCIFPCSVRWSEAFFAQISLAFYQISQTYLGFYYFSNTLLGERTPGPPSLEPTRTHSVMTPSHPSIHFSPSPAKPFLIFRTPSYLRVSQPKCYSHCGPDNCFRKLSCALSNVSRHPCPLPSR